MYNTIPSQLWMLLEPEVRQHLASIFSLVRTGVSEIRDQELIRDGHSDEDLKGITLEKMNEYIGSEETFPRAWELSCLKAKEQLFPKVRTTIQPADEPIEVPEEDTLSIIEKNHGKTKKN